MRTARQRPGPLRLAGLFASPSVERLAAADKALVVEESVHSGSQLSAKALDLGPQARQVTGKSLDVSGQLAHVDRPMRRSLGDDCLLCSA